MAALAFIQMALRSASARIVWAGPDGTVVPLLQEKLICKSSSASKSCSYGFGPIVRDRVASENLYGETLNISFKKEQGGYLHTEALKGVRTFALWPLDQAAQSCFGKD